MGHRAGQGRDSSHLGGRGGGASSILAMLGMDKAPARRYVWGQLQEARLARARDLGCDEEAKEKDSGASSGSSASLLGPSEP